MPENKTESKPHSQNEQGRQPESFSFTYSAGQQAEVKRIRAKYAAPEPDKMEQLRALDRRAEQPGKIAAICVGTIGALLFGLGMVCVLEWTSYFSLGVAAGLAGLAGMSAPLPLYRWVTGRQRQKMAAEVLALADDLLH